MYSHHFGLTQDPFSIAPDPHYLFMSERHREALAHLLYGVAGPGRATGGTGGGFVLLTGDIGTGKTTICRCFLEQIPAGCHVGYIFNPKLTVSELLQSICEEFHIAVAPAASNPPTVKDYIDTLNAFLLHSHANGQSSVLIIDEAQNLEPEVLEQLRLLTNLETSERKLLQIVLIGQPELRAKLASPALEQLAQRVIARFHLDALTETETTQYIAHRLAVAGLTGPSPFDSRSLQRIHRLAHGVPRRINLLCGRALLGAWANGLHRVNRSVVNRAATEVFGPDTTQQSTTGARLTAYTLGGLLVLGVGLAVSILWSGAKKTSPSLPTSVPSSMATGASSPASAANAGILPSAAAPLTGASSAIGLAPRAPQEIEDIETLLTQLPTDISPAWRELAPSWKLPVSDADPCQLASTRQLQCYSTNKLNVPLLRQLGRPGILSLQAANAAPVYAVLTGLSDQTATLQIGGKPHSVRLVALGRLWRGDFATYWRPPPAYRAGLQEGSSSPAIERLASQLSQLDGSPAAAPGSAPTTLDASLRSRVQAFQRAQGLRPDGQPGPLTFMQIDSATGVTEPRLQTESR